jgi:hypothetical protein
MRRSTMVGLVVASLLALAGPAGAAEVRAAGSTSVHISKGGSATRFTGPAFDTCTAPSLTAMQAWLASPYRAVGVYTSGAGRSCGQPNLTPAWVSSVTALGWKLLPIHIGPQAPCYTGTKPTITPARAGAQGAAEAKQAVAGAAALGLLPGSALYADVEHYPVADAACRDAVLDYLSGWTTQLHRQGYLSGVYVNLNSGAVHLADAYASKYARPDALWVARWDRQPNLTGWAGVPDPRWAVGQRIKQHTGDHVETWGGVRMTIDSNQVDAPVATVVRPGTLTASTGARTAPSSTARVTKTYPAGQPVKVVCRAAGSTVGGTKVWAKLSNGLYVTGSRVGTGGAPPCLYSYQVTSTVTLRSAASGTAAARGSRPSGALAWVACQRSGTKVGPTKVWDRLDNGRYLTDRYVATPSSTSWSPPVPRC